jgi:hypothetical protein
MLKLENQLVEESDDHHDHKQLPLLDSKMVS